MSLRSYIDLVEQAQSSVTTEVQAAGSLLPLGSKFDFEVRGTEIYLDILRIPAKQMRHGHASGLLTRICSIADAHGMTCRLVADSSLEPDEPGTDDLLRLYGRFGFEKVGIDPYTESPEMVRNPREPVAEGANRLDEKRVQVWSGSTINVMRNPSPEVFHELAAKGSVRGLISPDGKTVYVWHAGAAIHANIMQELALGDYDCIWWDGRIWNGYVYDRSMDHYLPALERLTPKPKRSADEEKAKTDRLYAELMADPDFAALMGEGALNERQAFVYKNAMDQRVPVMMNPSPEEFAALFASCRYGKSLRAYFDGTRLYAWDAGSATHYEIARKKGLGLADIVNLKIRGNGDVVYLHNALMHDDVDPETIVAKLAALPCLVGHAVSWENWRN